MTKAVFLVTANVEMGLEVAEAWQAAGAPGVTIIDGYGLRRLQEKSAGLDLPPIVSMAAILRQAEEQTTQIIFSITEDGLVETLIEAAQRVLGDLEAPQNGIAFVMPVDQVVGLRWHGPR